jgi:hypothetical protein
VSVDTLHDPAANRSCLWCNTDERAFADFLEWIENRGRDPRDMNDNTLDIWVRTWETETLRDPEHPVGRGNQAGDLDGYAAGDPKRGTLERGM